MVQEMLFKRFLIWSSGGPPVQWSGTIYAILKGGITWNIHLQLNEIWTSGSGEQMSSKEKFYGRTTDKDRSQ